MVVETASLIPHDHEHHPRPLRARSGGIEEAGCRGFAKLVVLEFPLVGEYLRGDQADRGQPACPAVLVKVIQVMQVGVIAQQVAGPEGDIGDFREIVGPADAVDVEPVPDQAACGRPLKRARNAVADQAGSRGGLQETAVGERLGQARGEVAVADAVGGREAVIPGQVRLIQVAHGIVAVGRGDEAVHLAVVPLPVRGVPRLAHVQRGIDRQSEVVCADRLARGVGIAVEWSPIGPEGETIAPPEHAEVIVVGVVLLHENDDVLDARQAVGASRAVGKWQGAGTAHRSHWPTIVALMPRAQPSRARCPAGPHDRTMPGRRRHPRVAGTDCEHTAGPPHRRGRAARPRMGVRRWV
jgi:hypothetical protein